MSGRMRLTNQIDWMSTQEIQTCFMWPHPGSCIVDLSQLVAYLRPFTQDWLADWSMVNLIIYCKVEQIPIDSQTCVKGFL